MGRVWVGCAAPEPQSSLELPENSLADSAEVTCVPKPTESQFHNPPNCKILSCTAKKKLSKPSSVCLLLSYQLITTAHIKT